MPFILACDYDGTLFSGSFPEKGEPKQEVIDKVKEFKNNGSEIVLWTCREGKSLGEAINRCEEVGLEFDAINSNSPSTLEYMEERKKDGELIALHKILADFYLDDKALNIDTFLKINVVETCKRFEKR